MYDDIVAVAAAVVDVAAAYYLLNAVLSLLNFADGHLVCYYVTEIREIGNRLFSISDDGVVYASRD